MFILIKTNKKNRGTNWTLAGTGRGFETIESTFDALEYEYGIDYWSEIFGKPAKMMTSRNGITWQMNTIQMYPQNNIYTDLKWGGLSLTKVMYDGC